MSDFDDRLAVVHAQIAEHAPDPSAVTLVAVTKGFGADAVRTAVAAGLPVGENYAQEAKAKHDELVGEITPEWHFIGQLQRNKVRIVAPFVDLWQSVDNTALLGEIAKRAPGAAVLIEVNLADEEGRGGCSWGDVALLIDYAREVGLAVRGLMGIAPIGTPEDARLPFRRLAETAREHELAEVSMGMSQDLEIALEEGSTMVRVGSALFGQRALRTA